MRLKGLPGGLSMLLPGLQLSLDIFRELSSCQVKGNIEFVCRTFGEQSQQAANYLSSVGETQSNTHANHVQWYSHAHPSNPISAVNRAIHLNRCQQ